MFVIAKTGITMTTSKLTTTFNNVGVIWTIDTSLIYKRK